MAKIRKVGIDVEGEAVKRDPAAALHAEGADFARVGRAFFPVEPHAGESGDAAGIQAILGQGADDGLLQQAQIPVDVGPEVVEVENGVAYQLAGAVIGNITAPVDAVEAGLVRSQGGIVEQQVLGLATFAQRISMRVFAEEQVVGRGSWCSADGFGLAVLAFDG